MLTIRLARTGKKKQPFFRLVINEKHKDPWGTILEYLGHYNPRSKEAVLNADRIKYWISKGAQTSDSVWNLLVSNSILEGKKRGVSTLTKKRAAKFADAKAKEEAEKVKKAEAEAAKKAAADAEAAAAKEAAAAADAAPVEAAPAEEKPADEAPATTEEEAA